jgi:hypothetical protein
MHRAVVAFARKYHVWAVRAEVMISSPQVGEQLAEVAA